MDTVGLVTGEMIYYMILYIADERHTHNCKCMGVIAFTLRKHQSEVV